MSWRVRLCVASNVFVAVMTIGAWLSMVIGWGEEGATLSSRGVESLKYFTVLSNLLSAFASAAYAVAVVRASRSGAKVPAALGTLKLAATTSVALTFLTVVVLFTLIFGFPGMFNGANLWFHGVLPLVSMVEWCLLDERASGGVRATLLATVPMLVYGVVYYANILINGVGERPFTNDFYGFTSWGMEWAPLVFLLMFAVTWASAAALYATSRSLARS